MIAADVIELAHLQGVELTAAGDKLRFKVASGNLSQELRELLSQHKYSILASLNEKLRRNPEPPSSGASIVSVGSETIVRTLEVEQEDQIDPAELKDFFESSTPAPDFSRATNTFETIAPLYSYPPKDSPKDFNRVLSSIQAAASLQELAGMVFYRRDFTAQQWLEFVDLHDQVHKKLEPDESKWWFRLVR